MHTLEIRNFGLAGLLAVALAACNSPTPTTKSPEPSSSAATATSTTPVKSPKSSPTSPAPADVAAKIAEILRQPVWVRPVATSQEIAAQEGMALKAGETIRTQGEAMAQIDLKSGLAFRLGKNSVLTLQPDNRLNLKSGDMITWVKPGQKVPSEIVTPTAIAGIRGTTVFVKIPTDPKEGTLFFAWEGQVAVRLPNQRDEILLKAGEEVKIWRGERDIKRIRQRIRRLKSQEWKQRLRRDRLLRGFKTPMPTLKLIETIKPGQVVPVP